MHNLCVLLLWCYLLFKLAPMHYHLSNTVTPLVHKWQARREACTVSSNSRQTCLSADQSFKFSLCSVTQDFSAAVWYPLCKNIFWKKKKKNFWAQVSKCTLQKQRQLEITCNSLLMLYSCRSFFFFTVSCSLYSYYKRKKLCLTGKMSLLLRSWLSKTHLSVEINK